MISYGVMNYVFGAPGTGKTTMFAYISRYFLKHGYKVYANFPLKDTLEITDESLGYFSFTDSCLLLDELGISMSNRAFKNGLMSDQNRLSYFKKIRHYLQKSKNGTCFVASQGWNDIDKKVRDLCTNYFCLKRFFGFTIMKPIHKDTGIDPLSHEPCDVFEYDPIWDWRFILRCRYYKYFDSYDAPELPDFPEPEDWIWYFDKKKILKEGGNLENSNLIRSESPDGGTTTAPM